MICGLELPDEYTYASTGEAVKLPSLIQPVPAAEEDAEAAAGMPSSKAEKASNVINRQGIIRNFTLDPSRSCRHLYPSPAPSGSARYRAVTSVWPLAIWAMRATAGRRGAIFTVKVKLRKHKPDDSEPGRMRDPARCVCVHGLLHDGHRGGRHARYRIPCANMVGKCATFTGATAVGVSSPEDLVRALPGTSTHELSHVPVK
jgi:hypothetical protein